MLDTIFYVPPDHYVGMQGGYNYWLVALSFVVACLASFLALLLARQLSLPQNLPRRRLLQWGGALALGAGIWSMHFIGMLAFKMDMPIEYDPALTLGSLFAAVLSAYIALLIVSRPELHLSNILVGAIMLGIGISSMHYLGMQAMIVNASILYRPDIFALSIVVAVGASGAALWIVFSLARHAGKWRKLLKICGAIIMGVGICGMHYTGMAAAIFIPHASMDKMPNEASTSGIALAVAITGIILSVVLPLVVYQTIRDDQDAEEANSAFPTKLLSLTVLCTFGVLAGLAGFSLHLQHTVNDLDLEITKSMAASLGWMSGIAIFVALLLATAWYFALRNIKLWRRELRDNKALLRTILNNMPLALFAKDARDDYRWLFINRVAEDMFCLKSSEIAGRPDGEFFPKEEAEFFRRTDEAVMAGGKLVNIEAEPVTTPKGTFIAHTIKVPIYDESGQPHILLGMCEDVTDKIKAQEELREAKERAEHADQAKSEFLANMSHELRTPINSVMGMTRLLQEANITPEQQVLTNAVMTSAATLLEIVNDILDLSKIEAGAMELEQIGFDLDYMLESVMDRLEPLAREKKLKLTGVKASPPPYVIGDPSRLSSILTNLISNAIKYTEHGGVLVRTSHRSEREGHIVYKCEVIDSGIGIPADKQASIFDKFVQADSSTTRKYGGTGLGLAITKQLVEMMGGTIGFNSETGRGSTFWFEIPFAVTNQLHQEKGSHRHVAVYNSLNPSQTRILVAEDHPMNQAFMMKLLQRFNIGYFEIVGNGFELIERYKNSKWDMILMDCHMPEKNGYDTTIEIRALEKISGEHTPIIAMTANAMVGDREKCLRCGMDDYISKPIVIEDLSGLMGQWIDFSEVTQQTAWPSESPSETTIDLANIHGFSAGDKVAERELVGVFIEQSQLNIDLMAANQQDGECKPWVEAAHMLKGGSATMGAKTLAELCATAQSMAVATAQDRAAILKQINQAYFNVKQALIKEDLAD